MYSVLHDTVAYQASGMSCAVGRSPTVSKPSGRPGCRIAAPAVQLGVQSLCGVSQFSARLLAVLISWLCPLVKGVWGGWVDHRSPNPFDLKVTYNGKGTVVFRPNNRLVDVSVRLIGYPVRGTPSVERGSTALVPMKRDYCAWPAIG